MANDYGYFGKGSSGYAHYMQTFNAAHGGGGGSKGGGSNGGCLGVVLVILFAGRVLMLPFV